MPICFACNFTKSSLFTIAALDFSAALSSSCSIFCSSVAALLRACVNAINAVVLASAVCEYFLMVSLSVFSSSSVLPTAFSLSFSKDSNSSL
jgi:hypothetical protein